MPLLKTTSDVQRDMGTVAALCHETCEPVYITRNGVADLVIMDAQAFDERMALEQAVYEREMCRAKSILLGWQQAQAGQLKPLSQVRAEVSR